jgi:hypothetical protein
MSQPIVSTAPVRTPRRTGIIAIALFAVLALGVGVGVAALTSEGSESTVHRSAPPTAATPAPTVTRLCGNDMTNLLAAIAALPPSVQAQVVGTLSHDLSDGLGHLALNVDPTQLPPPPDPATMGAILSRLGRADRDAIIIGLPTEQRPAVETAEQSAAYASAMEAPPACS